MEESIVNSLLQIYKNLTESYFTIIWHLDKVGKTGEVTKIGKCIPHTLTKMGKNCHFELPLLIFHMINYLSIELGHEIKGSLHTITINDQLIRLEKEKKNSKELSIANLLPKTVTLLLLLLLFEVTLQKMDTDWTTMTILIHYIGLTFHQLINTFLSTCTNFCFSQVTENRKFFPRVYWTWKHIAICLNLHRRVYIGGNWSISQWPKVLTVMVPEERQVWGDIASSRNVLQGTLMKQDGCLNKTPIGGSFMWSQP